MAYRRRFRVDPRMIAEDLSIPVRLRGWMVWKARLSNEREDFYRRRKQWARDLSSARGMKPGSIAENVEFEGARWDIQIGPRGGVKIYPRDGEASEAVGSLHQFDGYLTRRLIATGRIITYFGGKAAFEGKKATTEEVTKLAERFRLQS